MHSAISLPVLFFVFVCSCALGVLYIFQGFLFVISLLLLRKIKISGTVIFTLKCSILQSILEKAGSFIGKGFLSLPVGGGEGAVQCSAGTSVACLWLSNVFTSLIKIPLGITCQMTSKVSECLKFHSWQST